ncbi:peptidase [Mesobacillus campisalis]|uniref:Peptidase n=1 Tax=Mesobacillus campisalis TaxID=1408103 RepID=A0A0M2SQ69_9BACI|nr:class D sortase [Mesobacillus campisalis]KKK36709.1 peptidase [Mesobacillus campisalis]
MSVKKWLGFLLILTGTIIIVYQYLEWNTGRTSAEKVSQEEMEKYEARKKTVDPPPIPENAETISLPDHELGEKVATLVIPRIEQKYSVYWGTNEEVLKQGVGMFISKSTTVPGIAHTVLSGHRDTVFVRLGELEDGDELIIEYDSKIYTYTIRKIWITDENDRTVIVPKDQPTLTLTTCYPFTYFGNATERYIVQGMLKSVN